MKINADTKIMGIMGDPIGHSLSPAIHNSAFNKLNLNYSYFAFHVPKKDLKCALEGIIGLGIKGLNLTIPHKVEALKYVKNIDREARLIGAINTVLVNKGKLFGYNTDGRGLISSLKNDCNFNPAGKIVLILGSGGAARAIATSLAFYGAKEIIVANRISDYDLAKKLVSNVRKKLGKNIKCLLLDEDILIKKASHADIMINATSVGLHAGESLPLSAKYFNRASSLRLVYDIIYNHSKTKLLELAGSQGINIHNGLGMLLHQGALSFEIWTGKKAPIGVMRKALIHAIGKRG